jgi:integrase
LAFSLTGRVLHLTKPTEALRQAIGAADIRLHDLRRSTRTLLSRAGVSADIAEWCLGHALPGIRGTYDKHTYIPEMLQAYEALATLIDNIVNDRGDRVVPIRRKAPH